MIPVLLVDHAGKTQGNAAHVLIGHTTEIGSAEIRPINFGAQDSQAIRPT